MKENYQSFKLFIPERNRLFSASFTCEWSQFNSHYPFSQFQDQENQATKNIPAGVLLYTRENNLIK